MRLSIVVKGPRFARQAVALVALSLIAAVGAACSDGTPTPGRSPSIAPGSSPPAAAPTIEPASPAPTEAPAPSASPTPWPDLGELEGLTWRAIAIGGQSVIPGSEPTVTFGEGRMEGSDGCNVYNGPVSLAHGRYEPGELNHSLMACPGDLAAQADQFLAVMQQPGVVRLDPELGVLVIGTPERSVTFAPGPNTPVPPGGGG